MPRDLEIHAWLLHHAERLLLIGWSLVFGVLGVLGQLTTLLLGEPAEATSPLTLRVYSGAC